MNGQNMGSFASAIGGSGALKEAMARRGMSTLQQQSPASMGGAPPVPQGLPAPQAQGVSTTPQAPKEPETDLRIALTALTKFVGNESNLKKSVMDMRGQGII